VRVVHNDTNRGFAAACNQGAEVAAGEVVVFLNNDTLPVDRWLDLLLEPFADPGVVAAGPRSNFVFGPQLVPDVPYDPARMPELRRFVREWRERHAGEVTEVERLVGFCLAVRRDAFRAVGGFDEGFGAGGWEDADLCSRLRSAGGRLVIAHAAFVHHVGHATFDANGLDWLAVQNANQDRYLDKRVAERGPLISACLITRDEEADLPACLDALAGVVDEIVVYDTGSVDATVALARSFGARVIEGYWDDDFARARNEALAHCHGTWILHVDADEVVEADRRALERLLQAPEAPDAFVVPVESLEGPSAAAVASRRVHRPCRLFRRERGQWYGRLHEQVLARPGQPPLTLGDVTGLRIVHLGYLADHWSARNKAERNLRLAERALADGGGDPALLELNVGRSLISAGRPAEALDHLRRAVSFPGTGPATLGMAWRCGTELLCSLDRPAEALEWAEAMGRVEGHERTADLLAAVALVALGRHAEALDRLERAGPTPADPSVTYPAAFVRDLRARALAGVGDPVGAARERLAAAIAEPGARGTWAAVVAAWEEAGLGWEELAAAIPAGQRATVLADVTAAPGPGTDALLEALWRGAPGDPHVLAAAVKVAPSLDLERAVAWSARLRQVGADRHCPLMAIARDPAAPADRRVQAAAVAAGVFADPDAAAFLDAVPVA
jgi:glycosyltransferase involved in cell wall biosynthesis